MITLNKKGRLGNAMFKNCVASILSKKFNIKVESYLLEDELSVLNPKFHKGGKVYSELQEVSDRNLFQILKQKEINNGLNLIGYFQRKRLVLQYKNEILNNFDLQYNKEHRNNLFVHVRLGDCIKLNRVPDMDYYIEAIQQTNFDKGYISSDTPSHEIVKYLISRFNLTLYKNKPAQTINFAKDFGNLVISQGTFSWWMAFLSKAKSVFYPRGGSRWGGDIFVFDEWTPIDF